MNRIIMTSSLVAVSSLFASFLLALGVITVLGGDAAGNAWLMLAMSPLTIAWPASAFMVWQSGRLKLAYRDLARTHAQLAAAHRRLEEKASRDEMTGMLNRESFFALLENSRRRDDRGALLIIDADHFKKINDNYGHLTGDKALLEISAAILRATRAGDVLGRIGGEEFAALLVGANDSEALRVAERIRQEVEAIRFRPSDSLVPLTVSIGGTPCAANANVSDLMRAADRKLYEAKNRGRNRVVLDELPVAA